MRRAQPVDHRLCGKHRDRCRGGLPDRQKADLRAHEAHSGLPESHRAMPAPKTRPRKPSLTLQKHYAPAAKRFAAPRQCDNVPTSLGRDADPDHRGGRDARSRHAAGRVQDGHETSGADARTARHDRSRGRVRGGQRWGGADVVINCAAWTNVDGAESRSQARLGGQRRRGWQRGGDGGCGGRLGRPCLHVTTCSTAASRPPYIESDPVDPVSAYGRSKLDGERAVAAAAPGGHTIVRTAWLFGAGGRCFPRTILRAASQRPELTVVADQIGCPTFTGHLAPGCWWRWPGRARPGFCTWPAAGNAPG